MNSKSNDIRDLEEMTNCNTTSVIELHWAFEEATPYCDIFCGDTGVLWVSLTLRKVSVFTCVESIHTHSKKNLYMLHLQIQVKGNRAVAAATA